MCSPLHAEMGKNYGRGCSSPGDWRRAASSSNDSTTAARATALVRPRTRLRQPGRGCHDRPGAGRNPDSEPAAGVSGHAPRCARRHIPAGRRRGAPVILVGTQRFHSAALPCGHARRIVRGLNTGNDADALLSSRSAGWRRTAWSMCSVTRSRGSCTRASPIRAFRQRSVTGRAQSDRPVRRAPPQSPNWLRYLSSSTKVARQDLSSWSTPRNRGASVALVAPAESCGIAATGRPDDPPVGRTLAEARLVSP